MADHHDVPDRLCSVPDVGEGIKDGVGADLRLDNPHIDAIKPSGDGRAGCQFLVVERKPSPVVCKPALEPIPQPLQVPTANNLESSKLLKYGSPVAE